MNRRSFIHRSAVLFTLASAGQGVFCFGNTNNLANGYSIRQFEDEGLVQFSYAILADKKIVLVDPARDPRPYYAYAKEQGAKIIAVVETHPHADFVSSHLEIHQDLKVHFQNNLLPSIQNIFVDSNNLAALDINSIPIRFTYSTGVLIFSSSFNPFTVQSNTTYDFWLQTKNIGSNFFINSPYQFSFSNNKSAKM
jgi:hypothetical protein